LSKYKWGIIGPGSIANQFAEALITSENGELHGVASRSFERGEAFAKQHQARVVYDNYQALADDSAIDIIYIATPHSHHFGVAKMCLQAGKNVLMEKPLTVNAAQTEQLIALSEEYKVVFQEALWSRFMPCFVQVKRWIEERQIGEVQYITSQIGFAFGGDPKHRLLNPNLAGGAILDLGVYSVSLSQFLLSEYPDSVSAMGCINQYNVDDNTFVNMRYPSGVFSQFTCTIAAQCSNEMSVHGKTGSIIIPAFFWNGGKAILKKEGQPDQYLDFPHQVNGFEYQIEGTMDCVKKGALCSDVMNHQDSHNVMQTLDEIRRQIGLKFNDEIESLD
jgi:predicted dehydrogenase